MSILKIAQLGHPVLLEKAGIVKNIHQPFIKQIIDDMAETMLDAKGIGLAAPQVHVSKQIIIFREQEDNEAENKEIKIVAIINPKIYKISDDTDNQWEGCLSIPGMLGLVKRYTSISYKGFEKTDILVGATEEGVRKFFHKVSKYS